jgi:hypothetical protein
VGVGVGDGVGLGAGFGCSPVQPIAIIRSERISNKVK